MSRSIQRRLRRLTVTAVVLAALAGCASDEVAPVADPSVGVTGGDFHSLVADPFVAGRLYAGGHTNVAQSDDGGKTWTNVSVLDGADAMGWGIQPDAMWVSGHPGVNVSVDGGVTFARRNAGLPDTDVHAFGASGGTLYAAGPGIGLAMSTDMGESWTTVTSDAGQSFFGRILVDAADPSHLIAADVQSGVTESRDGGRTWTPLGTNPASWVSSADGLETIYASGGPTPQRSRDRGATWETIDVPDGTTLVEAATGILYAGVHDGHAVAVWTSGDDGATWARP